MYFAFVIGLIRGAYRYHRDSQPLKHCAPTTPFYNTYVFIIKSKNIEQIQGREQNIFQI